MSIDYGHAASIFMGFFAIMNPIANTPVFLGLTGGVSEQVRRKIAFRSLLTAFVIITVFAGAGKLIFDAFGITLPAFRITGGVLVFLVGFHMLHAKQSSVQHPTEGESAPNEEGALDVAVSPLALPILAGPGTIATAMSFAAAGGVSELAVTVTSFFLLCLITYGFFVGGQSLVKYLGRNGIGIVTRIMGLILAVIGTDMLIAGIKGAFLAPAQ